MQAEAVLIEKHSFLRKGTYRNRCHIYGTNGLLRLSIPISKGKGQRSLIKDVNISYDHEWQKLHWESMCAAYRSSPFFEFYEDDFCEMYKKETTSLIEFNMQMINQIKSLLGISQPWSFTDAYSLAYDKDWRDAREIIHPNASKNAIGGALDYPPYLQVFESKLGFLGNLSILDALFNLGPSTVDYLLNDIKITFPTS